MDPHQLRLWRHMARLIDVYHEGRLDFAALVAGLEADFQSAEFRDRELKQRWNEVWGTLEIRNAIALERGGRVTQQEVAAEVVAMRNFLAAQLEGDSADLDLTPGMDF